MTTIAQLRKTALALPETAERKFGDDVAEFVVHDRQFAAADRDGCLHLYLLEADAVRVLAEHSTAERSTAERSTAERIGRGITTIRVRVPFADINGQQLNHWVRRAWLLRAPKKLGALVAAADSVAAGEVGDLPKTIGRPATQALVSAGILTLAQVAERSAAELLEMHGIGPKAVRLLSEALSSKDLSLRD